jgi:hypothetical protein
VAQNQPDLAADEIADIIDHDKGYELDDIDRHVSEPIRRVKRKDAKR